MDKDRQIRFLYPPLFFLAFLWWAYHPDALKDLAEYLEDSKEGINKIVSLVAAGGAIILVLGFLIGTISNVFLMVLFRTFRCSKEVHYAAVLPAETLDRLWPKFCFNQMDAEEFKKSDKWTLYASATFVLGMLPDRIQEWLMRRWSSFIISTNTLVGLIIVVITITLICPANPSNGWWLTIIATAVFMLLNGRYAWIEYMMMVDFQSHRELKDVDATVSDTGENTEGTDPDDE